MEISPKARHKARTFAMQALYQWQMIKEEVHHLEAQYMAANSHLKVDWDFFKSLVAGTIKIHHELDEMIQKSIDRPFNEMNPVELALLRLGLFELKDRIDVPYKVVINEYVELTREFGAEEGHKFVNSVLDKQAKELRKTEIH